MHYFIRSVCFDSDMFGEEIFQTRLLQFKITYKYYEMNKFYRLCSKSQFKNHPSESAAFSDSKHFKINVTGLDCCNFGLCKENWSTKPRLVGIQKS